MIAMLCLVAQLCPTLCDPMHCVAHKAPLSKGILQASILEWVAMHSAGHLPNPGIKPRSPTLQADSLPSEPLGKPMNTGVGSLSLLQGIFLTQELNCGLLHCKASLVAQRLKRLPPMRETQVQSLGQEDPLEKEMAIHSSILAWRILWMEKPSRLQVTGSQSGTRLSDFTLP